MPVPALRTALAVAVTAAALVGLTPAGASVVAPLRADLPAGLCAADAGGAARLVTSRADGAAAAIRTGGVTVAVVTDPLVPPGVPHAVLATPAGWCTTESFNLTVAPGLTGRAAVATAFASTAGMPWLGTVKVRDVRVDGDTVRLTTVGGRHGVTSRWTLAVDAAGVREAAFETVAFGARGADVHALEGITSLPGHRRTWARDARGLLEVDRSLTEQLAAAVATRDADAARAAAVAGRAPGDLLEHDVAGQTVRFTLGVAAPGVEAPATGQALADRLRVVHEGMGRVYAQYVGWGLTDVWGSTSRTLLGSSTGVPDPVGYINFNSGFSEVCLACAFLGDFIEVHVNLAFAELTEEALIGVSYPDDNSYTLEVVGHEFTHAVQGGYGDGDAGLSVAFTEATATASQALFHEAENSAQRGSIEYLDTANGCEGFENGRGGWIAAQEQGPFAGGHTYDSCYFWWTYLAQHGGEGLVRLMQAMPAVEAAGGSGLTRHLRQLDLASPDDDGTPDLARWAAAYTAGAGADGYEIEDGSGDVHDWFALLTPAERSRVLLPGQPVTTAVAGGGTAGFTLPQGGALGGLPAGAEAYAFRVDAGAIVALGRVQAGDALAPGSLLAVVAPAAGPAAGAVSLLPLPAGGVS